MTSPLVVVTGTGTGIGKTHVTAALVQAWQSVLEQAGRRALVAGLKPIESGAALGAITDGETLEQASTFHVKRFRPPYLLARAVSPHLAAISENRRIELSNVLSYVREVRDAADGVVVELPGGLFSPLAPRLSNADLARALGAEAVFLVAPDRLGVLHDVGAATRAAKAEGLALSGIIVVAPEVADASTGTNANEMTIVTDVPVVASLPREARSVSGSRPELTALVRDVLAPRAHAQLHL